MTPEEALKLPIEPYTRVAIETYLERIGQVADARERQRGYTVEAGTSGTTGGTMADRARRVGLGAEFWWEGNREP